MCIGINRVLIHNVLKVRCAHNYTHNAYLSADLCQLSAKSLFKTSFCYPSKSSSKQQQQTTTKYV